MKIWDTIVVALWLSISVWGHLHGFDAHIWTYSLIITSGIIFNYFINCLYELNAVELLLTNSIAQAWSTIDSHILLNFHFVLSS